MSDEPEATEEDRIESECAAFLTQANRIESERAAFLTQAIVGMFTATNTPVHVGLSAVVNVLLVQMQHEGWTKQQTLDHLAQLVDIYYK